MGKKIYAIKDDETMFVFADNMNLALNKWRFWLMRKSEGRMNDADVAKAEPESITCMAESKDIIQG